MKKLQNDHTTPEQSKRLLELGVPADSANYYYGKDGKVHYIDGSIPCSLLWADGLVPCWSVGRLMEIYNICKPDVLVPGIRFGRYENMIHIIIDGYVYMQGRLDFSKLED